MLITSGRGEGRQNSSADVEPEVELQFEEGIEKTVRWYLEHQEWMDRSAIRTLSQSFATDRILLLMSMKTIIMRCIKDD